MESHIERLVAACGLRHFGYRQFGAPELASMKFNTKGRMFKRQLFPAKIP